MPPDAPRPLCGGTADGHLLGKMRHVLLGRFKLNISFGSVEKNGCRKQETSPKKKVSCTRANIKAEGFFFKIFTLGEFSQNLWFC